MEEGESLVTHSSPVSNELWPYLLATNISTKLGHGFTFNFKTSNQGLVDVFNANILKCISTPIKRFDRYLVKSKLIDC